MTSWVWLVCVHPKFLEYLALLAINFSKNVPLLKNFGKPVAHHLSISVFLIALLKLFIKR